MARAKNRHNLTIRDDDYFLTGALKSLSAVSGKPLSKFFREVVYGLLISSKHIDKKIKEIAKERLRLIKLKEARRVEREFSYEVYEIANINSKVFDMLTKSSVPISLIRETIDVSSKKFKYLSKKVKKLCKETWQEIKDLTTENLTDWRENILKLRSRGFTIKQIKKISPDYQTFKNSLIDVEDGVAIFKKRNI